MKKAEYRCENCGKRTAHYETRSFIKGIYQNLLLCASCLLEQKKIPRI